MSAHVTTIETTATATFLQIPGSPYPLKRPLTIEIEWDEGGHYVVSEPGTGIFHFADDLGTAVNGFFRVFIREFEFLRQNESDLSKPLSSELDRFQQLLNLDSSVSA
jgi:hypothetical protein